MALSAGPRGRQIWIAAVAAVVLESQPVSVSASVLDVRIAAANDDAEEHVGGNINPVSSDLELVEDGGPQTVGMRWVLAIPNGVTITNAWIQFTSKEVRTGVTNLEIHAQDSDDAAPFDTTAGSVSSRPRTATDVGWTPPPWALGEAAANERTPGLEALVQAVVNRPGWRSGHALVILITGSGRRTAWAWDGNAAAAPLLHVEFEGGPPPPPPPTQPIELYVGYYDTHHPDMTRPKPDPWRGSPGVVFVGTSDTSEGGWDSSCVRIDNLTAADITNVVVNVDIGSEHFALWGTRSIPAHGKLILAQTGFENFDGSDTNEAGCPSCSPTWCMTRVSSTIPMITVRVGGVATHFLDRQQVLNTRGVDSAGCPYTGGRNDESLAWVQVPPEDPVLGVPGPPDSLSLPPPTVVALDAPVPNPARRSVMFRFRMPVQGPVQLGMYDVSGRLVRMCVDTELGAGEYLRGLDISGWEPGVYFGVLHARGVVARTSFVVAR